MNSTSLNWILRAHLLCQLANTVLARVGNASMGQSVTLDEPLLQQALSTAIATTGQVLSPTARLSDIDEVQLASLNIQDIRKALIDESQMRRGPAFLSYMKLVSERQSIYIVFNIPAEDRPIICNLKCSLLDRGPLRHVRARLSRAEYRRRPRLLCASCAALNHVMSGMDRLMFLVPYWLRGWRSNR